MAMKCKKPQIINNQQQCSDALNQCQTYAVLDLHVENKISQAPSEGSIISTCVFPFFMSGIGRTGGSPEINAVAL